MRTLHSDAILLDVVDLHEADRIVSFLSREHGKRRGVARGARRKHSRFAGLLQPLAKARITWFEKDDRELVRIRDVDLIRPAHRLQGDLEGILLGAYLAGLIEEFAQEHEETPLYYRLLDSTLEALLAGVDRDVAGRYFETWILRLAGLFPWPIACPECERPFGNGGALQRPGDEALACARCGAEGGRGHPVSAAALELLRRVGSERLRDLAAEVPAPRVLREVEEIAGRVRRAFLQRELRSYEVMRRTLGSL